MYNLSKRSAMFQYNSSQAEGGKNEGFTTDNKIINEMHFTPFTLQLYMVSFRTYLKCLVLNQQGSKLQNTEQMSPAHLFISPLCLEITVPIISG